MPKKSKSQVTQADVARHAGVTRSMVSYVLNNSDRLVHSETREKILNAIKVLDYRPNKYAQGLKQGWNGKIAAQYIGVLMGDMDMLRRPYYTEILTGIHATAHRHNYHVCFIRDLADLRNPILFNELIHPEKIEGLILIALDLGWSEPNDQQLVLQAQEKISNIVSIDWHFDGISSVGFDRSEAASQACVHLFSKGHRHIAYIGQDDERVTGFQLANLNNGCRTVDQLQVCNANDFESGYLAAKSILGHKDTQLQAILAGSDEVAIGVLKWLREIGFRVPQDMALASIDNLKISHYMNPAITTVDVQKAPMGGKAVDMLLQQSREPEFVVQKVILPTKLVVRESS